MKAKDGPIIWQTPLVVLRLLPWLTSVPRIPVNVETKEGLRQALELYTDAFTSSQIPLMLVSAEVKPDLAKKKKDATTAA